MFCNGHGYRLPVLPVPVDGSGDINRLFRPSAHACDLWRIKRLASHTGDFRGARFSSLPTNPNCGRDERQAFLKTPAWEASKRPQFKGRGTGGLQAINFPAGYNRRKFLKVLYSVTERLDFVRLSVGILYSVTDTLWYKARKDPRHKAQRI